MTERKFGTLISEETYQALRRFAFESNRQINEIVEEALVAYLKRRKK